MTTTLEEVTKKKRSLKTTRKSHNQYPKSYPSILSGGEKKSSIVFSLKHPMDIILQNLNQIQSFVIFDLF